MRRTSTICFLVGIFAAMALVSGIEVVQAADKIVHDAEYTRMEKQFGEQWQADDKLFYTRILVSPVGDQLALDFSKALITHEQLGQDEIPDYLSISFSGVDAVNHFFGPSSLENEDVVVQLDRTLADLFAFIDKMEIFI